MKDAFSVKSTLAGVFIQQGSLYLSFSVELIVYADRVMFKNKTKKNQTTCWELLGNQDHDLLSSKQQNEEVPKNCFQSVSLLLLLQGCPYIDVCPYVVLRLHTCPFIGMINCCLAKGQNLENLAAIGSSTGLQSSWEEAELVCAKDLS